MHITANIEQSKTEYSERKHVIVNQSDYGRCNLTSSCLNAEKTAKLYKDLKLIIDNL